MTQLGVPIAWLVLSPLALLTNIIAVVVVCHYQGQFHGTDVAFLSLFVTMVMEAVVAVPVPAVLAFLDDDWRWPQLCSFYVGLVLCVRMSDLLVTLIVNMHWMCILRFTSGQEVYSSTTVVKILVVIAWVAAVVTGIVPVAGYAFYSYYQEVTSRELVGGAGNSTPHLVTVVRGECHFLPEGLGMSFVLFFILVTLTVMVLSLVASSDTLTVFHYMKKTAVTKYKAGRFYLPSATLLNSAVNKNAAATQRSHVNDRKHSENRGESADRIEENQTEDTTDSRHQNNGGLTLVHSNGSVPGGGHSDSPGASPAQDVVAAASRDSSPGDTITMTETAPADGRHMYGNGGSRSGQAGGGGVGRRARSAATVVVRPSVKSGVAKSTPPTVHARYNELNLSAELCRVVFCFTLLAALLNHLPFVVLQFLQLVQHVERQHAEMTVLWLTVLHSLLLPHVLWLLSRRYRHALAYTWTVHVRRDQSAREEDPSACTLQSYTRKVQSPEGGTVKVMAKAIGHAPITLATYDTNLEGQPNGRAVPVGMNSLSDGTHQQGTWGEHETGQQQDTTGEVPLTVRGQHGGRTEVMTTDLDDGMTVVTNLASHQVTYIYSTPPDRQSPASPEPSHSESPVVSERQGSSAVPSVDRRNSGRGVPSVDRRNSGRPNSGVRSEGRKNSAISSVGNSSSATASPSRSSLGTPTRGSTDINRSGSARQVWKEQMMKKHLPAVFINEAFESDVVVGEPRVTSEGPQLPDVTQGTPEGVKTQSCASTDRGRSKDPPFHYYMSGDYHHDYLRSDSLPRLESESEGGSFQYDDSDIAGILDREHSMRSERVTPLMTTFLGDSQDRGHTGSVTDLRAAQQSENGRICATLERNAAIPDSGTGPVLESTTQNNDLETRSLPRTAGIRKPRRSAAILKDSRRPSLQHQRSLQSDPETTGEDVPAVPKADSEGLSTHHAHTTQKESDVTQRVFYPTFQPVDSPSGVNISRSPEETDENADTDGNLPSPAVITRSNEDQDEADTVTNKIDTGHVFVSIDNVTTDVTHTDTAGDSPTSLLPPFPSDSGADDFNSFTPQGQATVLGMLMDDSTELPAELVVADSGTHLPVSSSDHSVPPDAEFDPITDFSPRQVRFNPFREHDHESASDSQTNPFFADLYKERNERPTSTGSETTPVAQEYQPTSSDSDNHLMTSAADDINFCSDVENTSFMDDPFRPHLCAEGDQEHPGVTCTDSDVPVPDTNGVVNVEETSSVNSDLSVVLEPYIVDRRPLWMDAEMENSGPVSPRKRSRNPFRASFDADDSDALGSSGDFGSSFGSNSEVRTILSNQANRADFGNPFAYDSFGDRFMENPDSELLHSSLDSGQHMEHGGSDPFQSGPIFDEETDRGFEEALALENVIGYNPYYGHFSRFESIEEEPEDFTDSPNSTGKEGNKETIPASQNVFPDNSMTDNPGTNPFGNMNEVPSVPSSSSNPSPVFSSTNPFSPQASPQRSFVFNPGDQSRSASGEGGDVSLQSPLFISGDENKSASVKDIASVQSPLSNGETVQLNGETPTASADQPLGDSGTSSSLAPRVRLTKPVPWKMRDSKVNTNKADMDSQTSHSAVVQGTKLSGLSDSDDKHSEETDTRSVWGYNGDDCNGSDLSVTSHYASKNPPVPPRPLKLRRVNRSGDDDSSVDQFDPVFF